MQRHFTLEYWIDEGWYVGKLQEVPCVFSQGKRDLLDVDVCTTENDTNWDSPLTLAVPSTGRPATSEARTSSIALFSGA